MTAPVDWMIDTNIHTEMMRAKLRRFSAVQISHEGNQCSISLSFLKKQVDGPFASSALSRTNVAMAHPSRVLTQCRT